MRPPAFWQDPQPRLAPMLLSPLGSITAWATRRRLRHPGWRAPIPVICCGNISMGGAGKTTLALDLLRRLQARGIAPHALTRGYGGSERGVLQVDPSRHDAARVGDESLLLAARAPTWLSPDRASAARAAVGRGAQCLVMDDGMQNPGLIQDCTLLVIDGEAGFGNGHLLPAGPLRESVRSGAARCRAAVVIGGTCRETRRQVLDRLPPELAVLHASLVMKPHDPGLRTRKLVAFAGIERPGKFFEALDALGLDLVARLGFPDHHRYSGAQLDRLAARARSEDAVLITTPKDAVRLPTSFREQVMVLDVGLRWADEAAIETILAEVLGEPKATRQASAEAVRSPLTWPANDIG